MNAAPCSIAFDSASDLEPLIAALRSELQEFGGLIRLLNSEQETIFSKPSAVTSAPESINRQHALALMSTRIRSGLMTVQGPGGERIVANADEIIEAAPGEIRPLLEALFSEVGKLALRAGDRANQNDWLRKRAPLLAATMAERGATKEG